MKAQRSRREHRGGTQPVVMLQRKHKTEREANVKQLARDQLERKEAALAAASKAEAPVEVLTKEQVAIQKLEQQIQKLVTRKNEKALEFRLRQNPAFEPITKLLKHVEVCAREIPQHMTNVHEALERVRERLDGCLVDHGIMRPSQKIRERAPQKRTSPEELERVQAEVMTFVRSHPGRSAGQIAQAVISSVEIVGARLRKLRDAGQIRQDGTRRKAVYYEVLT